MNRNRTIIVLIISLVVFIAIALLLIGTQQNQPDTTDGSVPADTSELNPDLPEPQIDLTVDMRNYEYVPSIIQVEPGETLTIEVVSVEGNHDFVIDELAVRSSVLSTGGDSEILTIEIPEDAPSGTIYEFYCSVGNHRELGMIGTLEVV